MSEPLEPKDPTKPEPEDVMAPPTRGPGPLPPIRTPPVNA